MDKTGEDEEGHGTKIRQIAMVQKKPKKVKKRAKLQLGSKADGSPMYSQNSYPPFGQIAFKIRHGFNGTAGRKKIR